MHKVSIVGIDNTGKTSVVKSVDELRNFGTNVETIHLVDYSRNGLFGNLTNRLIDFGETHSSKALAGLGYTLHLAPYFFEEINKRNSEVLVSDRDPIIDTLCHSSLYLSEDQSRIIMPSLQSFLEHIFGYADMYFYLEASPEASMSRSTYKKQLHEKIETLTKLRSLLDVEINRLERIGIRVARVNTEAEGLDMVTYRIKYYVHKRKLI